MLLNEKARESRLRRMAARFDLRLVKSRQRNPDALEYGGYMIIDPYVNAVVFGSGGWAFNASLDDVEGWLTAAD